MTHRSHEALIILLFGGAVILAAWSFQLIGGYQPCALCLQQRWPYYAALPIAGLMLLLAPRLSSRFMQILYGTLLLIFVFSFYLAVRHAGVEWKWWLGPPGCGAADLSTTILPLGGDGATSDQIPVYCDEAALRVLGLSFAGWNAIASLVLIILAGLGMRGSRG